MGDVLAPPTQPQGCVGASGARPARENPHGKRLSHILAVVHNPKQIVHRTTGLWLLVQLSPIWKPCRTHRREVSPWHLGNTELIKFPPCSSNSAPEGSELWAQGSAASRGQTPQCSSALPLFPQSPTAVCARVSLFTRVQLTSSTTGFYLQLPNMFQLEYYYSENGIISILTMSGHADTSRMLKKLISAFSVKLMQKMGTIKLLQVPPAL